jgi:Fe-S cluster assembly protein SufD
MSAFTTDAARALPGPDWLRDRRVGAAERFATAPLPTEAEEVWRYSRISELDLGAFGPLLDGVMPEVPAAALAAAEETGERVGLVVAVDGRVVRAELEPAAAAAGVRLGGLEVLGEEGPTVLDAVAGEPTGAFGLLHDAFLADACVVDVPDGVVLTAPIVVVQWLTAPGAATFGHLVVRVGRDAEATVVDRSGSADVTALSVPVTELDVAEGGRLRYVHVQQLGHEVWQVAHQASRAGRDATLHASAVALGGAYARLRQDSRLVGQGASSELLAVYFAGGDQMHDFRTLQEHAAPRTTSNLLFKGAVQDRARGVYSGLIRIDKGAQKSNAFQTNRNLVLSPGAHADSVPNLEIAANDVRCSHATAVGPIDDDQRYYVESRGIPPRRAEALIVLGFFGEVLERMKLDGLEAALRREVAAKLAAREDG